MEKPSLNPWQLASLGIQLVVSVLLGFGLGYWADGRFGTQPWLTILGSMFGIATGLYQLIKETSGK